MSHSPRHLRSAIPAVAVLLALASTTFAQRTNFAKFQRVTANTATSTYAADFAVDGIAGNFHSWRTGDVAGPHWLEITYPRLVTLASAHVYSGLLNATPAELWRNFRFQFHDGSDWTDIPGSAVSGNSNPEIVVVFTTPATATRFRLIGSDHSRRTLRELALFPPNIIDGIEHSFPIGTDVSLNLAAGRPTLASSINNSEATTNNFPKNAVDGYVDDSSRWLCNAAAGETLEIDLLDTQTVGSAHLYTGFGGGNALPDFALDWWDGAAWQAVPGGTVTDNTSVSRNMVFDTPVTTSRVRLRMTSAQSARLRELLLFPPRAGGYPLGQDVITAPPPTHGWQRFGDASHGLRCAISEDRRLGLTFGTVVFANPGTGDAALRWQLLYNYRNHTFRIRHTATGGCLALQHISPASGTPVVVEPYSGMPHQEWRFDPVPDKPNQFRILNAYSGHALQSQASNWSPGTPMVAVTPNPDSLLQQWFTIASVTHHPKKGIAGTNNPAPWLADKSWLENAYHVMPHSSWSYSWGRQTGDAFPYMAFNHTFNPMQWGNFNFTHGSNAGPIDRIRNDLQSNPKPVHLMGFNEPDAAGQANLPVATAISRWPRLEAMNVPLTSPAPAGTFNGWLADFYSRADQLGYRIDHTAIHWYKRPNVDNLISDINNAHSTWGRPVWLTEFSAVRWSGSDTWTHAHNFNFLAEFLWRAESIPHLARYSLFAFRAATTDNPNQSAPDPPDAPRSNTYHPDGTLTAFGQLYAGWDGVTAIHNAKAYHLHNRERYRRVRNPMTGSEVESSDPDTIDPHTQWFLVAGLTEGTVRIVSTRDARVLRWYAGIPVSLAASSQTATFVEWRVVPDQHGWFFIEHPASNQRLRINTAGVLQMGPISSNGNDYKWRFVVPAAPEPVAPPSPPTGLTAAATTSWIAVSWLAADGAATYALQRASTPEGPWTTAADGLTVNEWADGGLPPATTFYYRITATNHLGESAPSPVISATTEPEPLQLPGAPANLAAAYTGLKVTLSWSPSAGAADYTVRRSVSPSGPWQTVAQNLGTIHWEDTAITYRTTLYYTVTAVNPTGSSEPSAAISVTTPHEFDHYDSWASVLLNNHPPAERLPDANPDGDSLPNLLEYVFLTDPDRPDGNPFRIDRAGGGTVTLTFPWNWRATTHAWQLRHGTCLGSRAGWPVADPTSVEITRDADVDHIRITTPMTDPDRKFYSLEIITR